MNTSLQRQVEDEASQFGDIVQVNDIADIVNCPVCQKKRGKKFKPLNLFGLAWVASWCPQAK